MKNLLPYFIPITMCWFFWGILVVPQIVKAEGMNTLFSACEKIIKTQRGRVLPAQTIRINFSPPSQEKVYLDISLDGVRASNPATVNVYVNNVKYGRDLHLTNSMKKSLSLDRVQGKNIRVEIINHRTVLNTGTSFNYVFKAYGKPTHLGSMEGILMAQQQRSTLLQASCSPNLRIVVERTAGAASAQVLVKDRGAIIRTQKLNQSKPTVIDMSNASGKRYTVEVKNTSSRDRLGFRMKSQLLSLSSNVIISR